MEVKYLGSVPQFIICPEFNGKIKNGDIIDISEKSFHELANLQFQIVKKKRR